MKTKFYLQTSMIVLAASMLTAPQVSATSTVQALASIGITDTDPDTVKRVKKNPSSIKDFHNNFVKTGGSLSGNSLKEYLDAKDNKKDVTQIFRKHAGEVQLKKLVGDKPTDDQTNAARLLAFDLHESKFDLAELNAMIYQQSTAYNAVNTAASSASSMTPTNNVSTAPVLSSSGTLTTPATSTSNMPVIDSLDTPKTSSVSTPTVPVIGSLGTSTTPVTSASNMPTIGTVTTPILSTVSTTPVGHLLNIPSNSSTAPVSSLPTTPAAASSSISSSPLNSPASVPTMDEIRAIVLLQNDQLGSTTPVAKPTPAQVETVLSGSTLKIRQQVAWCIQTEPGSKLLSNKLALATLTSKTKDVYQFDLVFHNGQTDFAKGFTANSPQQFVKQAFSVAITSLSDDLKTLDLQRTIALIDLINNSAATNQVSIVNPVIVPKS